MRIKRTIPPTAAPISLKSFLYGLVGFVFSKNYVKRLEEELKRYFGVKYVFLLSSGKAALTIILNALKILSPQRNEVLIPAYICFSVPSAIVKSGLKVSICDIDLSNFDFDYKHFAEAIREDTLCVIPNHLFGMPADMDRINSLCKGKGIFVIEDAAQAMGGSYNGKKLGTIGDAGFFSLGRGKNITCGSGGIIVTDSDEIALTVSKQYSGLRYPGKIESIKGFLKYMLMSIFVRPSLYWFPSGLPFLKLGETIFYNDFPIKKLSGMQAGLLDGWQKQLEEGNRIRKENAEYFCEGLRLKISNSVPLLRLPLILESKEEKQRLYLLSKKNGFGMSLMYPAPVNEIKEIKNQFNGRSYPSAKRISENLLTVPTHHLLSNKDRERISSLLSELGDRLGEKNLGLG